MGQSSLMFEVSVSNFLNKVIWTQPLFQGINEFEHPHRRPKGTPPMTSGEYSDGFNLKIGTGHPVKYG
jgi:hypothetical protein